MNDDAQDSSEPRRKRLFWRSHATVFRPADPPASKTEVCGVVNARASLKRVHRGWRASVRVFVKPAALDEAVDEILLSTPTRGGQAA